MKTSTCCCHICKTSTTHHLYKREFLPCTQCNKIVCRNCFGTKFREGNWEKSLRYKNSWVCPSCQGICPCIRCRKKQKLASGHTSDGDTSNNSSSSSFTENMDFQEDFDEAYLNASLAHLGRSSPKMMDQSNCGEGDERDSSRIEGDMSDEKPNHDKMRSRIKTNLLNNLDDLTQRERRCESHIRDMENLLLIMKREREVIGSEKQLLESQLSDVERSYSNITIQ